MPFTPGRLAPCQRCRCHNFAPLREKPKQGNQYIERLKNKNLRRNRT
jgi:hypothetical protein